MTEPEQFRFKPAEGIPNSRLPLLLYRGALPPDAAAMERAFAANGWSNAWRDGVFPYHHFHSNAHEVLGIAAGEATLRFGGPHGQDVDIRPGDVVVIPAGVGHCRISAAPGRLVVGAYPGGVDYDLCRADPSQAEARAKAAAGVPVPEFDPLCGRSGPVPRLWR